MRIVRGVFYLQPGNKGLSASPGAFNQRPRRDPELALGAQLSQLDEPFYGAIDSRTIK